MTQMNLRRSEHSFANNDAYEIVLKLIAESLREKDILTCNQRLREARLIR